MTSTAVRLSRIERQVLRVQPSSPVVPADPVAFAQSLDIEPDAWQAVALRSSSRRQLWLACRQSGKSMTAAIAALHTALTVPGSLTLMVSPSQRQSGLLYRTVRDLAQRLPTRIGMVEDTATSMTFDSGSRVVSLPGSGQTIRGYSAPDLVIEDEAAFVADETHHAIRPMLAVSGGRLLLLSTPWGRRGHLWDLWDAGGDDWERVRITADEVPRIPRAFLETEWRTLPPLVYQSEYMCVFNETVDSVFRSDDIFAAIDPMIVPLFGATRAAEIHARA